MSLRWSSYVAPKSPKMGSKTQTAVFPLKSHFSRKRCKIGAKLLVMTNSKSHELFIGTKPGDLNDLKRRNAYFTPQTRTRQDSLVLSVSAVWNRHNTLRYFTEFGSFLGALRKSIHRYFLRQKCSPMNVVFSATSHNRALRNLAWRCICCAASWCLSDRCCQVARRRNDSRLRGK